MKLLAEEQLIPTFVQAYYAAQQAIESGNRAAATQAYQNLLEIYKQIAKSPLAQPHKELAHGQIESVYQAVAGMAKVTKIQPTPTPQPTPTKPPITIPPTTSIPVPKTTRIQYPPVDPGKKPQPIQPTSPRMFGLKPRDFVMLGFFAMIIVLVLFFKPAYIGLLSYADADNAAPEWRGSVTEFSLSAGQEMPLDIESSFHDLDGDELVYLATDSEGLTVTVSGSVVTIKASSDSIGDHEIVLMATDLKEITKVPVTVRVT